MAIVHDVLSDLPICPHNVIDWAMALPDGRALINMERDATGLTAPQRQFLDAYPRFRTMASAADALGIHPATPREWAARDEVFAAHLREAKETVADLVEAEMLNRAMAGVSPMSDTLLIFATKRHKPEYRDSFEVKHSGTVWHASVDFNTLPDDDRVALLQIAAQQAQRRLASPTPDPSHPASGE